LSPRTAKYVATLMREGDNFDYYKWRQRVREEEAQAKQAAAAFTSGEMIPATIGNRSSTPGCRGARPASGPALMTRASPVPRALWQSHRAPKSKKPRIRIRQRLEKVADAWDEFQASRARDAVYGYLEAVFAIVDHYKVRRKTNKLRRHAFKFSGLPFEKYADPFTAVIRCTCDHGADSKTISKWARALRYVAHCKERQMSLKKVMKEAGGVNACADLYARYFGRRGR
jgi:hypothetical protein